MSLAVEQQGGRSEERTSTGDSHLLKPVDAQAVLEGWKCVVKLCCLGWWSLIHPYVEWWAALKEDVSYEITCGAVVELYSACR